MRRRVQSWGLVVAWLVAWPLLAHAQEPITVTELLAKGGTRLSGEELTRLVSGATMSGTQVNRPETTFENVLKADGTLSGFARFPGETVGVSGTWSVDGQGRLCSDLRNTRGAKFGSCTFYFQLDGNYFSAPSEDRDAKIYRRAIAR